MGKMSIDRSEATLVDAFLRDELSRGERARKTIAPVIAHFLDCNGPTLVNDAIVAAVRGMLADLARQMLGEAQNESHRLLSNRLAGDPIVVDHLYALALEGLLSLSLEQRSGIDPVLSTLLQELIASDNPAVAELAMSVLAAQSRFLQSQRRMELPAGELPHDVFARMLDHCESQSSSPMLDHLQRDYDEGTNRIGLLARLTSAMRGGAIAGLDIAHSGLALFVSSATALVAVERDDVVFACHEDQAVRMALLLKAAGLDAESRRHQIEHLGGSTPVPDGIEALSQARAQEILQAHIHAPSNGGVS